MLEAQDKFVDDSGRILTITSISGNVIVSLDGEIKTFISEDAFNTYLKNNKFDKINLTPEDHIEEFESEVQHLINVEDNTMKTESLLKKLDSVLESDSKFKNFKKSLNVREEVQTSNVVFTYYGVLPGSIEEFLDSLSFKGIKKYPRFIEDRPYLFSISDKQRKLLRFFVLSQGEYFHFKILSVSTSRALSKRFKAFLTLELIPDNIKIIKPGLISGKYFYILLKDEENDLPVKIKLKTENTTLSNGDLEMLLMKFRTKGEKEEEIYESRVREEDEDLEIDHETEHDEIDDDSDYEHDSDEITDDDIDTSDEFGDEDEEGDEQEITADEIEDIDIDDEDDEDDEEPVKTESIHTLRRNLRKYCKTNESKIRSEVKKKKTSSLIENVVRTHRTHPRRVVEKEFRKLISTLSESMSLTFDKPIKSMNTSMEDGKTVLTVEFEDAFPAPVDAAPEMTTETPAEDTSSDSSIDGLVSDAAETETPAEDTPKTEESYKKRSQRFLNQSFQ